MFSVNQDGSGFTEYKDNFFNPPSGALTLSGTTLYGSAPSGGFGLDPIDFNHGDGSIFNIQTNGSGPFTTLGFSGTDGPASQPPDPFGSTPFAPVTISNNVLYGTSSGQYTPNFDQHHNGHISAIFSVGPGGTTVLHSTPVDPYNSISPSNDYFSSNLAVAGSTLFGMTSRAELFSMNTNGSNYHVMATVAQPVGFVQGEYGSVIVAGSQIFGTDSKSLFSINQDGSNLAIVHDFSQGNLTPAPGPVAIDGKVYGIATATTGSVQSILYSINLDGTGYQVLHAFGTGSDGSGPNGHLSVVGRTLYGSTTGGGQLGGGIIYAFAIPEPSSFVLAAAGLGALCAFALKHKRRHSAARR